MVSPPLSFKPEIVFFIQKKRMKMKKNACEKEEVREAREKGIVRKRESESERERRAERGRNSWEERERYKI